MWLEGAGGRITELRSAAVHFHLYYKNTQRVRDFKLLNASRRKDKPTEIYISAVWNSKCIMVKSHELNGNHYSENPAPFQACESAFPLSENQLQM